MTTCSLPDIAGGNVHHWSCVDSDGASTLFKADSRSEETVACFLPLCCLTWGQAEQGPQCCDMCPE